MFVLIGRAAASLGKHPWLYLGVVLGTIALQAIVYRTWHNDLTIEAGELVVTPLALAIVYARTQADVDGSDAGTAWSRALERAWAVIVIGFAQTFVLDAGIGSIVQGGILDRVLGVVVLMMGLTFLFADIDAVVSDDGWLLLIPRAFVRSIRAAWTRQAMTWLIAIFLIQLFSKVAEAALHDQLQRSHLPDAVFWASIPLDAVLLVPLGILLTFVYFDAIGYEPKRSCGE